MEKTFIIIFTLIDDFESFQNVAVGNGKNDYEAIKHWYDQSTVKEDGIYSLDDVINQVDHVIELPVLIKDLNSINIQEDIGNN